MFTKKLERMYQPPSDLKRYDNEGYMQNPLLKFRLADVQRQRHSRFLKYRAALEKVNLCRKPLPPEPDMRLLPENDYIDNLRREVRKIEVPKMLRKTEKKILSYAPTRLKSKYPELVDNYMKDVHEEFDRLMKIYSMNCILVHPEFADEDPAQFVLPIKDFHFKLPGRTANYPKFLENKRKISKKLLIVYPQVRMILNTSELEFPKTMVVLDPITLGSSHVQATMGLGGREALFYKTFVKYVENHLGDVSNFLRWSWYPKMVSLIRRQFRRRIMPTWLKAHMFKCLEALMNRQINMLKINTLDEFLRVGGLERKIPTLKINMIYQEDENTIELDPSLETIYEMYVHLVDATAQVATGIEPLEPQIDSTLVNNAADYLRISMNDYWLNEYKAKLRNVLRRTYAPIKDYIIGYKKKYYNLYAEDVRRDLDEFLRESREFDEYFKRIETYFEFIRMLQGEPENDYFEMCVVCNKAAFVALRRISDDLIARITEQMVKEHIKAEEEICAAFEDIKTKALTIPRSTEELLASAEYMISVKKELIFALRDRIQYCLQVGTNLVELTEMSPYHFDLTIRTINWLQDINEICDYNASQQEHYKFLFEEHLQDVIRKLNEDIDAMLPNLAIIDDMSEPEQFRHNYILLRNFMGQLKTFDDYVAWINKEEKLFKMAQTSYPKLEVMKGFIIPFAELMKYV